MWSPSKGSGGGKGLTVGMSNSFAAQSSSELLWGPDDDDGSSMGYGPKGGCEGYGPKGGCKGLTVGMGKSMAAMKGWGKGKDTSMYGWGPWADWSGGSWSSGPYVKSEKQLQADAKKKEEEQNYEKYKAKHAGNMPPVDWLIMPVTCKDVAAGYSAIMPAMEYTKDKEIFADSHRILQDFFVKGEDYTMLQTLCDFDYDHDMTAYPEVQAAWKECGNFENGVTIAKCAQTGQWAAGFGGKDKATRAAKLALAVALALALDQSEFVRVATDYPAFAELCYGAQKSHPLVLAQALAAASAGSAAAPAQ